MKTTRRIERHRRFDAATTVKKLLAAEIYVLFYVETLPPIPTN